MLLLLLCPTVTMIITGGVTALRGAGAFQTASPLRVTFWAGEVRLRRKNGSQRLVYN